MTPKAPLFFAFAASLSFHTLAVVSLGGGIPWISPHGADEDVYSIAYVESPQASVPVKAPAPKEILRKVKKAVPSAGTGKSAPALKKASPARSGSDAVVRRRKGIKPYYQPAPPAPKKAADLLMDPVRGRVFANYFSLIKRRIDDTVRKRYSQTEIGRGTVSLVFALNADGTLAAVSVAEKQTKASADVRDFAVRCVRETAPFVAFPSELDVPRIAFNVTVLFDEL